MNTTKIKFDKTTTMFVLMIVLFFFFVLLTGGRSLNASNINNLVMQNGYIIVLSVGMLFCTLTGNIDLGVGSVVAASGAVAATLIVDFNVNFIVAILAAFGTGIIFGLFNGLIISKLKVSPFIVTLATMLIARGVTYVILDGQTKGPLPEAYTFISSGFLPKVSIGELDLICLIVGILACALLFVLQIRTYFERSKHHQSTGPLWFVILRCCICSALIMLISIKLGVYQGFPFVLIILILIILFYSFVARNTVIGREIYALGGNERAAKMSGIDTQKVMFFVYLNMGILCAVVGILLSGRNASATADAGENFELDAITACYLGGVATSGGKGKVSNAVIGALIIGILNNGMSLCGLDNNIQKIVKGLVLILALSVDILSRKHFFSNLFKKAEIKAK